MAIELIDAVMRACTCRVHNPTDKLILMVLANYANQDAMAWPNISTLSAACALAHRNLQARMRGLEAQGLIETKIGGGRVSSVYRLKTEQLNTHTDGSKLVRAPSGYAAFCPVSSDPNITPAVIPASPLSITPAVIPASPQQCLQHHPSSDPSITRSVIDPSLIPHSNHRDPLPTQPAAERKERDSKPAQTQGRGQEPDKDRERTDDEVNAAWSALTQEAGPKLAARAMTRSQWLDWAQAWQESGGSIEDCRTVGSYIARGGLDWLKKSKTSWIASHWADVLAQALESPQKRAERATSEPEALTHARMRKGAVPPPPEALEALSKLGFAMGGGAK